jgi:hypothetical protein
MGSYVVSAVWTHKQTEFQFIIFSILKALLNNLWKSNSGLPEIWHGMSIVWEILFIFVV